MARDWSRDEVEATVASYFGMLEHELSGVEYSKAAFRRKLLNGLSNRSEAAAEYKYQNVSAVLLAFEQPYIDGYKPAGNYQALLEQVVLEWLQVHQGFFRRFERGPILNPSRRPPPRDRFSDICEPPPERALRAEAETPWTPRFDKADYVLRDAQNRRLGRLGEEFVVDVERRRLHDEAGRPDLAKRVEWIADTRGDGAGYDIASFNQDGSNRLIEVKTTGLGKYFPFCVSRNEVRCSQAMPSEYYLYRVFSFGIDPRLYTLNGALTSICLLDAIEYRAVFRSQHRPRRRS